MILIKFKACNTIMCDLWKNYVFNCETKNELLKKLIFFFLSEITEQSFLEIFDDKQHYL